MFRSFRAASQRAAGHAWTIGPKVRSTLVPPRAPRSVDWRRQVDEWGGGPVYVTGQWRARPEADTCVVVVHGLGGCADSDYCIDAARAIDEYGYASLRLSLRGANRSGDDIYHGGLYRDVEAALEAPILEDYERIFVVGFSLGGHVALRAALELDHPKFKAVAAICSPLDLAAGQRSIDAPNQWLYRQYLLRELIQIYRATARRKSVPTPLERIRRVERLREWDALTVVPRFGFHDVDDYYETVSVAGELDRLERPATLVASRRDPLIPPHTIEPALANISDSLDVHWTESGGHVFFPANLDLGFEAPAGLLPQILSDLEGRAWT